MGLRFRFGFVLSLGFCASCLQSTPSVRHRNQSASEISRSRLSGGLAGIASHGSEEADRELYKFATPYRQDESTVAGPARGRGNLEDVVFSAEQSLGYIEYAQDALAPSGLKCAQQASRMLKLAGVPIKGSLGVVELVHQLKAIGWKACGSTPGAVAYSNKTFGNGPRSHIGIVAKDGYSIFNNLGRKVHRTRPWKKDLKFLCPPA